MRLQTIPPRLFVSRLPTGVHEFFCYIQLAPSELLPNKGAQITWQIKANGNGIALVSGTMCPSEQQSATGRIPIAVSLPYFWNGGQLDVQVITPGETSSSSFVIHRFDQQKHYQLPVIGTSMIVGGHRIGEVHRSAWQVYSQQFAWDFLPLAGQLWSVLSSPLGNQAHAQDFSCFGAEVSSPANGKIVKAIGSQPDLMNVGELPNVDAFENDLSLALGNYVVIDHGDNVWSLLAHLLQGSLQIETGQTVECRQVLGKLGNSGFSSGPHLHFHFMDGPDPLTASPLPIGLDVEGETYAPQAGELVMN